MVREAAPAVDLHHRQPLTVRRLEHGIAADVDLTEIERNLRSQLSYLRERALAEVAALRVVDDDLGRYG